MGFSTILVVVSHPFLVYEIPNSGLLLNEAFSNRADCEFGFCWFAYLVASGLNLHRNTTELILLLSKATFNGDNEFSISFAVRFISREVIVAHSVAVSTCD
ncbi:hypothetical protein P8452_46373 [Trifolium repens]|nr:hypothetical protein P8452_46373 [Trifolium repens]